MGQDGLAVQFIFYFFSQSSGNLKVNIFLVNTFYIACRTKITPSVAGINNNAQNPGVPCFFFSFRFFAATVASSDEPLPRFAVV